MNSNIEDTYKNIIFISKPRCASTTIFNFLYDWYNKLKGQKPLYHVKAKTFIKVVGKDFFFKKYSFGIVRRPSDLLISWFYHHKFGLNISDKVKNFYPNSFDNWIDNGCKTHWQNSWQRLFNISNPLYQKDWLFEKDKLLVNKFIKFENIQQEDFAGINFKNIPVINKKIITNPEISNFSKKKIENYFKIDYDLFNY